MRIASISSSNEISLNVCDDFAVVHAVCDDGTKALLVIPTRDGQSSYLIPNLESLVSDHAILTQVRKLDAFLLFLVKPNQIVIEADFHQTLNAHYFVENECLVVGMGPPDCLEPLRNPLSNDVLKRKNFTLGPETQHSNINRMLPMFQLIVKEKCEVSLLFVPPIKLSKAASVTSFYRTLVRAIGLNYKDSKRYLVLYSGGADSGLLRELMVRFNVHYCLVSGEVKKGSYRITSNCYLDINEWQEQIIHDAQISNLRSEVQNRMPFAQHEAGLLSALYLFLQSLDKKCIVLNGQNADTIFGLGPTENEYYNIHEIKAAIKSLFNRLLIWLACLFLKQATSKSRLRFLFGTPFESLPHFIVASNLTGIGYFPILSRRRWNRLYPHTELNAVVSSIDQFIKEHFSGLTTFQILLMYKIVWFFQGGDNKIIHALSEECQVKTKMPFGSKSMLSWRYYHEYDINDVIFPKWYIKRLTKKLRRKY